jgi:5-oxoprolinase (ATP-hydrolysing)
MEGGGPGASGKNTWIKQLREKDGDLDDQNESRTREINIGGKATVWMGKGDRLLIETPGGGAWGIDEESQHGKKSHAQHVKAWEPRGSLAERAAAQAGF